MRSGRIPDFAGRPSFMDRELREILRRSWRCNTRQNIRFAVLTLILVDALVTVSGDGLLNEFINGLMDRDDWQRACKLPIGIIPAGKYRRSVFTTVGIGCTDFYYIMR